MESLTMTVVGSLVFVAITVAPMLDLPPRPADAPGGTAFALAVAGLPLAQRESRIVEEIFRGNVPASLRSFVPVRVTAGDASATFFVTPDYLAVGSDDDFLLIPLGPYAAQVVADRLGCSLPTPKMVDAIYENAALKLSPSPIPPSPAMTRVSVFRDHSEIVRRQRGAVKAETLTAGHKKDVVLSNRLTDAPGKVAIYGWHKRAGEPIQPLYVGHAATWVDYSHGVRLVRRTLLVNGRETTLEQVLADPELAPLLSNEGVVRQLRYDPSPTPSVAHPVLMSTPPGETLEFFRFEPAVRVAVDRPSTLPPRPVLLVVYALPNGSNIEQTIGRTVRPADDPRFDIQHIGAQTRFLRETIPDRTVVVAYLENDLKSWPAWRKTHGDARIPALLDALSARLGPRPSRVVLSGHSGGGSMIFGYINSVERIPDHVERIAFLDANYAYETDRHRDKLMRWLRSSSEHYLCVLAYNDAVALLNGKSFVSASGGTWGRSQQMLSDLEPEVSFLSSAAAQSAGLRRSSALGGRVTFWLKENPDRKIFHTVQVERNGFIESMLCGTPQAGAGYRYFGERAFGRFIRDEP